MPKARRHHHPRREKRPKDQECMVDGGGGMVTSRQNIIPGCRLLLTIRIIKNNDMKQVSFYSRVCVRDIASASTLTPDDREAMWYSLCDIKSIRQKIRDDVAALRQDSHLDGNGEEICLRGLEFHFSSQENRAWACHSVLCEQHMQFDEGIDDQEELAEIYVAYTSLSRRIAQMKGLEDQQAVIRDLTHCWQDEFGSSGPAKASCSAPSISSARSSGRQASSSSIPTGRAERARRLHPVSMVKQVA